MMDERAIVEITVSPDYKAYRKFNNFTARRRPMTWVSWFSAYCFIPMAMIYLLCRDWRNGSVSLLTLIYIAVTAALIVWQTTTLRRAFKRNKHSFIARRAAFFEDGFTSITTGQSSTQEGSHGYDDVAKAYEIRSAFYLKYVDGNWGYFPKEFFVSGQIEALRALFARKFGDRFRRMK